MPIKKTRSAKKTKMPGIEQDGPNRFLVRARWTDPKTGKRMKREGVANTFEDAVVLQAKLRCAGAKTKPTRLRFADYAEQWMKESVSGRAASTQDRYTAELAHAIVGLGDFYVDTIEAADVRAWRDGMLKDAAVPTVNGRHRTLRIVLEPAVESGLLKVNPARKVPELPVPRTKGKRGTALKPDGFRRVLDVTRELMESGDIAPDVGRMLQVVAWTGVRRGELLALKWCDWDGDELLVTRSMYKRVEKETKTDDPRLIAVAAPLREVLTEQRHWLLAMQHPGLASGLVFPADPAYAHASAERRGAAEVSWYRCTNVLTEPLAKVVAKAGVPAISPHSFRRTFENLLRKAGVEDLVRRSLAGWRTNDAQEIYAGIDQEERAEAARRMVELVLPKVVAK